MRTRSRSGSPGSNLAAVTVELDSTTGKSTTIQNLSFNNRFDQRTETISDELNDPRARDSRAKLQKRLAIAERIGDAAIKASVKADLYTASLQCHKCTHTKQVLSLPSVIFKSQSTLFSSISRTHTYSGGYGLVRFANASTFSPGAGLSVFNPSHSRVYSSNPYHTPDWFALLDRWHEACNSIVPSSTLIGESIVENAIFIDAFKAVINPTSLLKKFIQVGLDIGGKKSTLGKVAKAVRTSSDAFLGYQFGVKPAIDEVKNILGSHRKVESRLRFLRSNAGGYVPIRVRGIIPSDHSNPVITSPQILCDGKWTEGCISALGKVREDLNYVQDWMAYAQYFGIHKFLGLAWELVPFSFVVDWVTNAGDYINKYTTPHFANPFYNIRNICHSFKTVLAERYVVPDGYVMNDMFSRVIGPVVVAKCQTSSYFRDPGIPDTSGSVDFSRLGTFHGLASGALLIQKIIK